MAVVSCQGPEEEEQAPLLPPIGSIVGVWQIHETFGVVSAPGCVRPLIDYIVYVAQNGNLVVAQTGFDTTSPFDPTIGSNGAQFTGTINGSTLAIQGVNPDGAGTMSTASVSTVAATCNSLTGTQTFSSTATSCSGTIQFTGARLVGSGCPGTLAATAVPESAMAHNTAATAQPITRPAEVSGTIASGMGEDDWYSFTLATAGAFTVLLNGLAAPINIDLFFTDDTGTMPLASSTSGSSREAVANTVGPATYKIRVSPPASGTVSYTLLIQ